MTKWPRVRLRDVAVIDREGINPNSIRDGSLFVGLENIEAGGRLVNVGRVSNGDLASTKFCFRADHVLYGKLRPYLAKIALPDFDGICSTDILPVLPSKHLDRSFLAQFLRQPAMVSYAASRADGINLPRLSPNALANFEIPLPPLAEQKRIAAILDQADELRRKRREALATTNSLVSATFESMFRKASCGGPTVSLGSIVEEFRYGTSNKSGRTGYPTLRIPNIIGGSIDVGDLKHVQVEKAEFRRLRLVPGDLLFVRTNGNPGYVGRSAVVDDRLEKASKLSIEDFIYASYLIRARLEQGAGFNPVFVQTYLSLPQGRRQISEFAKTSAGQFNINTEGLSSLQIPKVPFRTQCDFAAYADDIAKLEATQTAQLTYLDSLFASLQHRAFRGELTPTHAERALAQAAQ